MSTANNNTTRNRRVAATFVSQYYRLLLTDPEALVGLYTPTAQFAHDAVGSNTSGVTHTGPAAIRTQLMKLYAAQGLTKKPFARVAISDVEIKTPTEQQQKKNKFVAVVSGCLHRAGNSATSSEFRQMIELDEFMNDGDDSGVFGVCADTLHFVQPSPAIAPCPAHIDTWAAETPPMFAKAGGGDGGSAMPPLQQPPTVAAAAAAAEQTSAKPASDKKKKASSAAIQEGSAPASKKNSAEGDQQQTESKVATEEQQPSAPKSFADLLREKSGAGGASANNANSQKKTVEAVDKSKDAKKSNTADTAATDKKKSASEATTGKKNTSGSSADDKKGSGARDTNKGASSSASASAGGGSQMVFYDAFLKNLPAGTTEAQVEALVTKFAPVKPPVKVQSKPDKEDPKITRTFAFIRFDFTKMKKGGSESSAATIVETMKKSGDAMKMGGKTVIVDIVKEKYEDHKNKTSSGGRK